MKFFYLRATAVLVLVSSSVLLPSAQADRAASEEMRQSDVELNQVYQKALAAMTDADAKSKLRESQRAWIAFRDAEMALLQTDGFSGNTARQVHMMDINNNRAKELQDLIDISQ